MHIGIRTNFKLTHKDKIGVLDIVELVTIIKTYEGEVIAAEKPGFITSHHHHNRAVDTKSTGNTPSV